MTQPAYHLRPNKAVDRLVFMDAIRRLEQVDRLSEYTYYGLGGPYLEEFRMLYEVCEGIGMVSIEHNPEVVKRQRFHLPCGTLRLRNINFRDFVTQYEPGQQKSIFWLDYTGLGVRNFGDFQMLLAKVIDGSVVKITMQAEPNKFFREPETFGKQFAKYLEDPDIYPPREAPEFAKLIQDMLQRAVQEALRGIQSFFQPLNSFFYSDGTYMLTLTGIVCSKEEIAKFRELYEGLEFINLDWGHPREIDVPFLSTKERLHLQHKLPGGEEAGETLQSFLGYMLDGNESYSQRQFQQYADFHRYYPYFMRAVP